MPKPLQIGADEEIVLIPTGMGIDSVSPADSSFARMKKADAQTALKCAQDPNSFREGMMIRGESFKPFVMKKNKDGVPDTFTALSVSPQGKLEVPQKGDPGYLQLSETVKMNREGKKFVALEVSDRNPAPVNESTSAFVQASQAAPRPQLPVQQAPSYSGDGDKPAPQGRPLNLAKDERIVLMQVNIFAAESGNIRPSGTPIPVMPSEAERCAGSKNKPIGYEGGMGRSGVWMAFVQKMNPDGVPDTFTALSRDEKGLLTKPQPGEKGFTVLEEKQDGGLYVKDSNAKRFEESLNNENVNSRRFTNG